MVYIHHVITDCIRSGSRWDAEMYMDVDEVAVPDPHTLWDKIMVRDIAEICPRYDRELVTI